MTVPSVDNRLFQASVENRGDHGYHATTQDARMVLATDGSGGHPIDVLLASLSACIAHHIVVWLRDRNLDNPGFGVSASGTLTEDRRLLSGISVTSDIARVADDAVKRKELLEYVGRCPVYRTLSAGCPITFSWG
jgi:uncharacterized OsmC-like protein